MARTTSYKTATDVQEKFLDAQEKVLDAIKIGQEATVEVVRDAAEAFSPKLPDFSSLPSLETLIGFTQDIWERQREFNMAIYEAIAPVGRSVFGAAKDAAKSAEETKPAEHAPRTAATKA